MTRSIYRFGLCVTLVTLFSACGDGNTTSGSGGSGATTTTNGGGGTAGSTTTTGGTGGTGATGGSTTTTGGTGGTGATGGSTTTTGGTGGTGGSTTSTGGTGGSTTTGGAGGMTTTSTTTGMGGTGGGGLGGSDQIAAVRAAPDGMVDIAVQGAFVTYTKPVLGLDAAGFFMQAEGAGPAIFIAIDPATLFPEPKVGDQIDFVATAVTTSSGVKEVTAINAPVLNSTGNSIEPLITDVSMAMDLVSNLDAYESRAIRVTGDLTAAFASAGAPQVAAKLTTAGLDDANLRLRMPEAIRATYDLTMACSVSVDYGVMWRFNAVAQPSVYDSANLLDMTCPQPTVVSAVPLSATEVIVKFDRVLDPATVDAADFTFDNGLTAMSVVVNGKDVTVTTTPDAPGTLYTVTVAGLTDLLGAQVGMPNTAMFQSFVAGATMLLNEINPNIGSGRDLVELLVLTGGSVKDVTLRQRGTPPELLTLATLPDVTVAAGDIIVVHLSPAGATGAAPGSELASKTEYANAMYSANFDGAWDFHGGNTGLTYGSRIVEIHSAAGIKMDAVPFVQSGGTALAMYPTILTALQMEGGWLPADCGGMACMNPPAMAPNTVSISVDYLGVDTTAAGKSLQRIPGMNMHMKSDWNTAAANSWGAVNP